jgi:acyl-CoA synthetase (AMP-forming)/AMP-acid ligase II
MNISLILQMAADAAPDRIGLVCDGRRWSYGALLAAAQDAARLITLSNCGHVALLDESSEASAIALFGAALAGTPYVPLNYRLADADLAALLGRIAPALIIGDASRVEHLSPDRGHIVLSRSAFVAGAEASHMGEELPEPSETVAVQLFTSGTTAAPKAAILRHGNLLSYILGTVEFGSADPEEAALVSVPPYHIAGIAALLSSIYAMRRIVLLPAFDPDVWLALVQAERVTNAFLVPTMLARIITRVDAGVAAEIHLLQSIA